MKYYTDGWLMGSNPSHGGGWTVIDENNKLIERGELRKMGFTNNEAEIRAIKFALEYAEEGDQISTDSMCCLSWVNKGKSKARPDLNELMTECKNIKEKKKINLMWEGRDFNLAGIYNEEVKDVNTLDRIFQESLLKD